MNTPFDLATAQPRQLIQYSLTQYHEPLRVDLERLHVMVQRVVRVHGDKDPGRFAALAETFGVLRADLEQHLLKEERVLFPWILSGRPVPAAGPIRQMLFEHEQAGALLDRLREITGGYTAPDGACATWRALWSGLGAMDRELREHIRLEDEVLFPRATAAAPSPSLG